MVAGALEAGLDGLAITDHNVVWPDDELDELRARHPTVRIFRGVEVTSAENDDFLLYGLESAHAYASKSGLARGSAGRDLVRRAHELGLVVALAHPFRFGDRAPVFPNGSAVDGVEIMSINMLNYTHPRAAHLASRFGAFAMASSDAHAADLLGLYAVRLDEPVHGEQELAHALVERRFSRHVDVSRLSAMNARITACRDRVLQYIAEGLSDPEIRARVPIVTGVVLRAVREGLDGYHTGLVSPNRALVPRQGCAGRKALFAGETETQHE